MGLFRRWERIEAWYHHQSFSRWTPTAWRAAADLSLKLSRERRQRDR